MNAQQVVPLQLVAWSNATNPRAHIRNPFDRGKTVCLRDIPRDRAQVVQDGQLETCHSCGRRVRIIFDLPYLESESLDELNKRGYKAGGDYGWVMGDLCDIARARGLDIEDDTVRATLAAAAIVAVRLAHVKASEVH